MPTKEASLLADFLLAPAALRTFMTLEQFSEIFPRSQQENPVIKSLYDELQRLRHEDVQEVRANIAAEIKRSRPLQREVARARRDDDHRAAGVDFVALGMEGELSGRSRHKTPHTLQTIHPDIKDACKSIEAQIQEMEAEIEGALSDVQEAVGELSDLRYGSLPRPAGRENISEEVLATLKRLEAVCSDPEG